MNVARGALRPFWVAGRVFVMCWQLRRVPRIAVIVTRDERPTLDEEWRALATMHDGSGDA